MHILHLIGTLNPAAGGPAEGVRLLLAHESIGYTAEVATLDDPESHFLDQFSSPVHSFGPVNTTYGYSPLLVPWLDSNLKRFDVVVINGIWQYFGLAALRSIAGTKPYVVFIHGMLDPYFKRRYPLKHLKKWLYWILVEHWVLRGASRVIFTTEAEAVLAEQSFWLHSWKRLVVPYGADSPPADSESLRAALYQVCPEVEGRRFLLFLGRIHAKKGCDLLIKAFAKVAARDPELHLLVAGPDQQGLMRGLMHLTSENGIANRVHWPGLLRGEQKWAALRAAEAFVLPSHQENFGIAVAEALACGTPVLISDKVNIAEEVATSNAGLVDSDTLDGTQHLLERWIDLTSQRRMEMSQRARLLFQERYDADNTARALLRALTTATEEV